MLLARDAELARIEALLEGESQGGAKSMLPARPSGIALTERPLDLGGHNC